MLDLTKDYTCNGQKVRIYADKDTYNGNFHCGILYDDGKWSLASLRESDLTEVYTPKEGDFVRIMNYVRDDNNSVESPSTVCSIRLITMGVVYFNEVSNSVPISNVIKWEPKEGEWCFFWDNNNHGVVVRRFKCIYQKDSYKDSSFVYWKFCAPFSGTLPKELD